MADSRRAFKYYDTPLEEHLVDDVERRRRAMLQQRPPHHTYHRPSSEDYFDANEGDVGGDDSISAYYGNSGRPLRGGTARRRLASPTDKSREDYHSNASSPSRSSWVLRPLAVPAAQSPSAGVATSTAASGGEDGGGKKGGRRILAWLAAVAMGAATVTLCSNPAVQVRFCGGGTVQCLQRLS